MRRKSTKPGFHKIVKFMVSKGHKKTGAKWFAHTHLKNNEWNGIRDFETFYNSKRHYRKPVKGWTVKSKTTRKSRTSNTDFSDIDRLLKGYLSTEATAILKYNATKNNTSIFHEVADIVNERVSNMIQL